MEMEEAKQIIAAYVSGDHFSERDLNEAVRVARSDRVYGRRLLRGLGLWGRRQRECDVFLSNLAEFSEMDPEVREAEMPELVDHMKRCRSCLKAYWEVVSIWSGRGTIKKAEPFIIVLDPSGSIRAGESCPPPQERTARAAGHPPALLESRDITEDRQREQEQHLEWELEDPDAAVTILFVVEPDKDDRGTLLVGCEVKPEPWSEVIPDEIEVTIVDCITNREYPCGSLSAFRKNLPLPSNSNLLQLHTRTRDIEWTIPLNLTGEGDD
jgi:hypothetical protein